MKKWWFILIAVVVLAGCSNARESFAGSWSGTQVSQAVGTDYEISGYNYWTVSADTIDMSYYVWVNETGKLERRFDPSANSSYSYEWKNDQEIMINGKPYHIEACLFNPAHSLKTHCSTAFQKSVSVACQAVTQPNASMLNLL